MSTKRLRRVPPLIVCPYCGPDAVAYAGVVLHRVCPECKAELANYDRSGRLL